MKHLLYLFLFLFIPNLILCGEPTKKQLLILSSSVKSIPFTSTFLKGVKEKLRKNNWDVHWEALHFSSLPNNEAESLQVLSSHLKWKYRHLKGTIHLLYLDIPSLEYSEAYPFIDSVEEKYLLYPEGAEIPKVKASTNITILEIPLPIKENFQTLLNSKDTKRFIVFYSESFNNVQPNKLFKKLPALQTDEFRFLPFTFLEELKTTTYTSNKTAVFFLVWPFDFSWPQSINFLASSTNTIMTLSSIEQLDLQKAPKKLYLNPYLCGQHVGSQILSIPSAKISPPFYSIPFPKTHSNFLSQENTNNAFVSPQMFIILMTFCLLGLCSLGIVHLKTLKSQKKIQTAIRETRTRLQNIVENSHEIIFTLNQKGQLTYISPVWDQLLKTPIKDAKNKLLLNFIPPEDHEKYKTHLSICKERKRNWGKIQLRLTDHQQKPQWFSFSFTPYFNSNEEFQFFIGAAEDISQQKVIEGEKNQLEELLQISRKMESLGRLAGGIAHDLNNLLSPVIGYAELALDDLESDHPAFKNLHQIRRAGERAKALLQKLLAFSRKQHLSIETVDLHEIVLNLHGLLRPMIPENILLETQSEPKLHPIRADKNQIEQVLINLVINAKDAMESGGTIRIITENFPSENSLHLPFNPPTGDYVLMTLSDTGDGISPQVQKHIFEPFFSTKEFGKGTGLGLATVYGIIKQHEGHIEVFSEKGKGTSFYIFIPKSLEIRSQSPVLFTNLKTQFSFPKSVLVVEDNAMVRHLIQDILIPMGLAVKTAQSGIEALEFAEQEEFELLITDLIMPDMDGKELFMNINQKNPSMKVLFMSGYADKIKAMEEQMELSFHFISKPISRALLVKKLQEMYSSEEKHLPQT